MRRSGSALIEEDNPWQDGIFLLSLLGHLFVLERILEQLPLPANVRYTVVEEYNWNMELDLVELGLCDVIYNFSQWSEAMSTHGLDWMLDPMAGRHSLSFCPTLNHLLLGSGS